MFTLHRQRNIRRNKQTYLTDLLLVVWWGEYRGQGSGWTGLTWTSPASLTSQRLFWVTSEGRTKRQENGFCWIVETPAHRLVHMRGPGVVNTFLSGTRPTQPSRADQNVRLLTSKVQTIQNNLILMIYKWPSSLQLENCLSPLQLSIFNPRNTCYRYLLLILMKWPNTRKGKSRIHFKTSKV